MGGAKYKYPYPKHVWSPAGGWWCNPRHWRRNTGIAMMTIGTIAAGLFYWCESYTVDNYRLMRDAGKEHPYIKENYFSFRGQWVPKQTSFK